MEKLQTIVFLMRHGETNGNYSSDQKVDGERILTEEGRGQVKKVGEYLKSFAPSAIYSSPLKRTLETAEIIQQIAEIPGSIIHHKELEEVYTTADYDKRPRLEAGLIKKIVHTYQGEQVVLISHQWPMEETLKELGFTKEEIAAPCLMSQGYRLVFAGEVPVECQKINPANI